RWTVNTLTAVSDLDADVPLQTDVFYHIAATYDGSLLALYLNGNLHTYKVLSGKIRTTTFPFLMGQMLPGLTDYNFKGVIDAVKIYDFALPPDAVNTLYGQGVTSVKYPILSDTLSLVLSPNPVSDVLTVQLAGSDRATPSHPVTGTVQVRDLAGRLILEKNGLPGDTMNLNVKNCKPGIYTVLFISEDARLAARFIKI
nr:T9SS type A sorting domain-containing protein [Saprospiraceae bacterium]